MSLRAFSMTAGETGRLIKKLEKRIQDLEDELALCEDEIERIQESVED